MSQYTQLPTIPIGVYVWSRSDERWGFEWTMKQLDDGNFSFTRKNRLHGLRLPTLRAESVREQLLKVDTPDQALQFLNETDCYFPLVSDRPYLLSDFPIVQDFVRSLSVLKPEEWKAQPPLYCFLLDSPVTFAVNVFESQAVAMCGGIGLDGLIALAKIEKLQGSEFRYCARLDCREVFKIESRHARKFCSPECAHLAAVWRSRGRLAEKVVRKQHARIKEVRPNG